MKHNNSRKKTWEHKTSQATVNKIQLVGSKALLPQYFLFSFRFVLWLLFGARTHSVHWDAAQRKLKSIFDIHVGNIFLRVNWWFELLIRQRTSLYRIVFLLSSANVSTKSHFIGCDHRPIQWIKKIPSPFTIQPSKKYISQNTHKI